MATTAPLTNTLRRALLYVPASSPKFLEKSRSLAVDNITYDLEDSVTPDSKTTARLQLRDFLSSPRPERVRETAVRINAVDTGFALADLQEVLKGGNLDAVVVPKVQRAGDLGFVTDVIRHALPERHTNDPAKQEKPPLGIIALIESARALSNLDEICRASPYLQGLIFAAEDFALDLSITRTPSLMEFLFARSAIVTAARAHEVPSVIDLVCTQFRGEEGQAALKEECEGGKTLGFNGKQCIHPSQVEVTQRVYSPSEAEVEWAVRVVIADEKADKQGRGAWTLDGKMIDVPVVGTARGVVAKAGACGFNVAELRKKHKDQEPE